RAGAEASTRGRRNGRWKACPDTPVLRPCTTPSRTPWIGDIDGTRLVQTPPRISRAGPHDRLHCWRPHDAGRTAVPAGRRGEGISDVGRDTELGPAANRLDHH